MVPTQKSSAHFHCECCHYTTSRKSQYERHLSTDKHKILQNPTSKKFDTEKKYICDCGKSYKHSSTLYAHKKLCNFNEEINNTNISHTNNNKLVEYLMKENKEIKDMILEIVKNGITNTNTNHSHNTTNSHNKAFNLQFFLNETCKDAMNITDFVDSITLQLSDLEKVGEMGYVEGISNIIIKNLNNLDETKRPLHCTDKKRETIYIKDEGQWEKEDDNKPKLKKAINKIAHKNIKLINEFREKYPECRKSDSHLSDKYNKMIIEAMGGPGDNNTEKTEKIIKNITKVTTISQK